MGYSLPIAVWKLVAGSEEQTMGARELVKHVLALAVIRPLGEPSPGPSPASITFYVSDGARPAKGRQAPGRS